MDSALTSRVILPKYNFHKIKNKRNFSQMLLNKRTSLLKEKAKTQDEELNTSWDFTPFPDLYFPSQKSQMIKDINGLNFKSSQNLDNNKFIKSSLLFNEESKKNNYSNIMTSFLFKKNNSLSNIFKEKRGDITKRSSPAYSFGSSRDDCKFPFLHLTPTISPSPCSYNLRPLEGLGGHSIKYTISKRNAFNKSIKFIEPGPGHYNNDNCDIKNNGSIMLSSIENSKISNFWNYSERKDNSGLHSDWNMKPSPGSYNINNCVTMFNKKGKFPISNFKSNISKTIDKYRGLSKGRIKFVYPGPGSYNHYSIFKAVN